MNKFEALDQWIQPQHLTAEGIQSYRAAFESHSAKVLQITDFLHENVAGKVSHFLTKEANYEPIYGLYGVKGHAVAADEWYSAAEAKRFYFYNMLGSTNPQQRLSPNLLVFMRLRQTLSGAAFKGYISAVSGLSLGEATATKVHQLRQEHFLKPHDDTEHGRRVAFIIYLSNGWQPAYGGALQIVERDGKQTQIEALFNSIAFFDVTKHEQHQINDILPAAEDRSRLTIGGWFRDQERV